MPSLTSSGSPTFNADSTCTIDGTDRLQAPSKHVLETVTFWWVARFNTNFAFNDATANSTLAKWDAGSGNNYEMYYTIGSDAFRMRQSRAGVTLDANSAVQSFATNTDKTVIGYAKSNEIGMSVDGVAFVKTALVGTIDLSGVSLWDIGSAAATVPARSDFYWFAAGFGVTPTDAHAATIHAFGNPDPRPGAFPLPCSFVAPFNSLDYMVRANLASLGVG